MRPSSESEAFVRILMDWLQMEGVSTRDLQTFAEPEIGGQTFGCPLPSKLCFLGRTYAVNEGGKNEPQFYGHVEVAITNVGPNPELPLLRAALHLSWALPSGAKLGLHGELMVLSVRGPLLDTGDQFWWRALEDLNQFGLIAMRELESAGAIPFLSQGAPRRQNPT